MSVARLARSTKKQRGQFLTPPALAASLVEDLRIEATTKILEPSMGDGSFVLPIARRLAAFVNVNNGAGRGGGLWGAEIDAGLYERCLIRLGGGGVPHVDRFTHLVRGDFFSLQPVADGWEKWRPSEGHYSLFHSAQTFDLIVGNPPFGGSIDPDLQDDLDRHLGLRGGLKVKKETYAWFIVRCIDLLRPGGRLRFLCSDTLLTIPTMRGLRAFLAYRGDVDITPLNRFSAETTYSVVVLDFILRGARGRVRVDKTELPSDDIERTGNLSWGARSEFTRYFDGPVLGDYMTASSGMTIGCNELFVRPIHGEEIIEPYAFEFEQRPVTLADELSKARLNRLGPRKTAEIEEAERRGDRQRVIVPRLRAAPLRVRLPHPDYRYYNKASNRSVYSPPTHVVYWKDNGDAVLTFKRTGNWYLRGVGGMPYFGRSGLTWQLIAPRLRTRFLPGGYILDSGAPCAFLNGGVSEDELWLILGWTLTPTCSTILKTVINHTRNIQSKDFERLPYPFWLDDAARRSAKSHVQQLVHEAIAGRIFSTTCSEVKRLDQMYAM